MKMYFAASRHALIRYGLWLFFGLFLYVYLSLFKNALIDDAFITLRYAKTLLISGTWGFFPGIVGNSATSPLNVLLLTFISLVMGPTVEAALWLYLICLLCTAFLLTRLSVRITGSEIYGWLAVFAFVFNPLLISTIGLESILFTMVFVWALYSFQFQKWNMLAMALGLLTLTRPEGILFFLIFFLFIPTNRIKIQLVIIYFLSIAPWYLFSWVYLGSFVPDTFFIKTKQGTWWQWDFFNGMTSLYYYVYPLGTILSFLFLPLTGLFLLKRNRQRAILMIIGCAGLVHFIGYSLLRIPPFHWYYIPQVITIILVGSLGLGAAYRNSSSLWQRGALGLVTSVYLLAPALGMFFILARDHFVVREMPIHSNWATYEQYEEAGLWLKANHATNTIRLIAGEIGTLAYYCDCRLLDRFSDRGWINGYIAERNSHSDILAMLLKFNFAFYSAPKFGADDYVLRAFSGEPDIPIEKIKQWDTSTTWIKHGFLILSRQ